MRHLLSYLAFLSLTLGIQAARDPMRLTHGPMLGNPTSDSVRVWGRTSDPGEFSVRYGTVEGKLDQVSEPTTTRISNDNTGYAILRNLKPDQTYHYQIHIKDRPHGLPGSFLTLPNAEYTRNAEHNPKGLFNFRFQIGSCANQNPIHGNGHRAKTYENLNRDWAQKTNFHIMNGDWLYEELREYPVEAWRLRAGIDALPPVVNLMPTVVGVWENYKLYLSRGISLSKWHTSMASAFAIGQDGIIVTNHHVLAEDEGEILGAMDAEGTVYGVEKVLAANRAADLVILKLRDAKLIPMSLGKPANVGADVWVISHPNRKLYTMTKGTVSRYHMIFKNGQKPGRRMSITADYAKGSSGAPVFNHKGQVVGVVSATSSIYYSIENGKKENLQMVVKNCIPVESIHELIQK